MARLYSDEDFPHPVVRELARLGHDVLTCQDDQLAGQRVMDELILNRAIELNRAILTHNHADFSRLHRLHPIHAGVISCTRDANPELLALRIHERLQSMELLTGQFVRIIRPNPSAK